MSASVSNWQLRPLGEISTTTSGGTPSRKRKDYFNGSILWVKSGELNDDYISDTEEHITEEGLKNSSAKLFAPGTVLIALYGATVGKTSILKKEASTNQAVCGITPGPELDADYLRYHLIFLRRELLSHRYGGAQPNISQQVVRNQKIAYPPLPEQKKIAHILSTVQRAIEAQERIIQTTTELRKALMHKLFTEGLRNEPQKQTEIGPVPESWEVVPFADSVSIKNGQIDPRLHPFNEMLHVGSENIESNTGRLVKLSTNSELNISSGNYHFTPEDVLYSKIRPYLNKVALPDFEGTCSADMYPLRSESHFIREFLFYYLLSDNFKKAAMAFQDRTGIPKINRAQLGSIELPCPSKEEQKEISDTLLCCDSRRNLAQRKVGILQSLYRTLLHELMTAKTRVHELELPTEGQAA